MAEAAIGVGLKKYEWELGAFGSVLLVDLQIFNGTKFPYKWRDHRRRQGEGGHLPAAKRAVQRPHRRRLPGEVPRQPVSQRDERPTRALRDRQEHAARDRRMMVE